MAASPPSSVPEVQDTANGIVDTLLAGTDICETDCDIPGQLNALIDAAINPSGDPGYEPGLMAGGLANVVPTGPPWSTIMSFDANPGNLDSVSTDSRAVNGVDPMGPNAAWTNRAEPNGPWQPHWTVVYTGQIYDADGKMSFREHFVDTVWLEVDGQVILNDADRDAITTATVDFGAGGWFDFEVRFGSGFTDGGMHPNEGIGFEWDRDGGTSWQRPKNSSANTADVFRTPAQ